MSASDESNTPQDISRRREAVSDMQERLAQFGRLVGQVRDELPEQHARALGRIEQGIESLAERIAAFGQERRERAGAPSAAAAPADADEPWDLQSAEALMRAYETAEQECASAEAQAPRYRQRQREAEAAQPHALPGHDAAQGMGQIPTQISAQIPTQIPAWLEARFADLSQLLQRALADVDPAGSLAALDRRLDQFERRLDSALGDMALGPDHGGLKLIDAHVSELAGHFEAVRQQLDHLDAMDGQLRELAQALEGKQPHAGFAPLSEDAIAAIIDTAAERAASRIAASMPAKAGSEGRVEALEAMLQDYVAERRRSEEVSDGILHTIEDALVRILDRIEEMETVKPAPTASADPSDADARERDGIDVEHDRLAEAYAEGARVLGHQDLESDLSEFNAEQALHAADYAPIDRRGDMASLAGPAAPVSADDSVAEEQTRQELRASALRAKQKAQAVASDVASESTAPDESKAGVLGQGRIRTWTSARAGSYRPSLLLGVAMALLFCTGFMAVDSLLGSAPPAGAQPRALEASPAALPRNGDLAQPSVDWKVRPITTPQAATTPPSAPEAATDDPSQEQPAPTRRLQRLMQSGTAGAAPQISATPVALSSQENADTGPAGREIPPAVGSAELRQAAASGDAFAQLEVATRFAEGKGVAQDHGKAFAWYERAATRGLAAAQFRLAVYYERGIGVAADTERAKAWYTRAADQGYVRAMHNLGVLTVGSGDYATAARWFGQAAERGLADSQFNLAVLHENGRGVPKDLQEAYKWFALAARSGDPVAAGRLEQIRARLQPAELEAAEQKLAAWRPSEQATGSIGKSAGR